MKKNIKFPIQEKELENIKAGDTVLLSGVIYVARDAAHKKMQEMMEQKKQLPFELKNNAIYYMGPSPAKEGSVIGSAGPTTSGRMDDYTPALLHMGLKAMIGKGKRSEKVKKAIVENKAVYFAAIGGAGALLSKKIKKAEIIAFENLGAEAILRIEVEDFPVITAIDPMGNDLYEDAVKQYCIE